MRTRLAIHHNTTQARDWSRHRTHLLLLYLADYQVGLHLAQTPPQVGCELFNDKPRGSPLLHGPLRPGLVLTVVQLRGEEGEGEERGGGRERKQVSS